VIGTNAGRFLDSKAHRERIYGAMAPAAISWSKAAALRHDGGRATS
jgi:hypothetical protein